MSKKLCIIGIVTCLMLTLTGCKEGNSIGKASDVPLSFEEFVEKYSQADMEQFEENPAAFIADLSNMNIVDSRSQEDIDYFSDWELINDNKYYISKKFEGKLFNNSVNYYVNIFNVTEEQEQYYIVSIGTSSTDDDTSFRFAAAFAKGCIDVCGEPTSIYIDGEKSSEKELLEFLDNDEPTMFEISYSKYDDGNEYGISRMGFGYSDLGDGHSLSSVNIN